MRGWLVVLAVVVGVWWGVLAGPGMVEAACGPDVATGCILPFYGANTPATTNGVYTDAYHRGIKFSTSTSNQSVATLWYYYKPGMTMPQGICVRTWAAPNTCASGSFSPSNPGGSERWVGLNLGTPYPLVVGTDYLLGGFQPVGHTVPNDGTAFVDRTESGIATAGDQKIQCSGGSCGSTWTAQTGSFDETWFDVTVIEPILVAEFDFTNDGRRVVEVVGTSAAAATMESSGKLGGTNVIVDWRIRTNDSEQRIDNARSVVTGSRNVTSFSDCVTTTAFDVVPWESDDLPAAQWHASFELVDVQLGCPGGSGGAEIGWLQVPKVTGIVVYDVFTGTCMAQTLEDVKYFRDTWNCTFVTVNGSIVNNAFPTPTPTRTPVPSPTPPPAISTATPAPTVGQVNAPDVVGQLERNRQDNRGLLTWIGDRLGQVGDQVTGAIGNLGAGLSSAMGATLQTMFQADGAVQQAAMEEIYTAVLVKFPVVEDGTGIIEDVRDMMVESECEEWEGLTITVDEVGGVMAALNGQVLTLIHPEPVVTGWCPDLKEKVRIGLYIFATLELAVWVRWLIAEHSK